MQKRGLSEVVTAILIVVLAVVAVIVIWAVIRPLIYSSSGGVDETKLTIMLDIKPAESSIVGDDIFVKVSRLPGKGELAGINFIFHEGGNQHVIERNETHGANMQELAEKRFAFNFNDPELADAGITKENLEKISIAPIVVINNKKVAGAIQDTWETPSPCMPKNCTTLNMQCGTGYSDGCGGTLDCGTCTAGVCENGKCVKTAFLDPDGDIACNTNTAPEGASCWESVYEEVVQPNPPDPAGGHEFAIDSNGVYNILGFNTVDLQEGTVSKIEIWVFVNYLLNGENNWATQISTDEGQSWSANQPIYDGNFIWNSATFTPNAGETWEQDEIDNLQVKMTSAGLDSGDAINAVVVYAEITYTS